jgi:hypothetical protein
VTDAPKSDDAARPVLAPTLAYEMPNSRERLDDGSVRITVLSKRGGPFQYAMIMVPVLAAVALALYMTAPRMAVRDKVLFVVGLGCFGWLMLVLITRLQPRQYTSVFEVGTFGIQVDTLVAGDRIRRTFPLSDITALGSNGSQLIIASRGEEHPYLGFEPGVVLEEVAEALREAVLHAAKSEAPLAFPRQW